MLILSEHRSAYVSRLNYLESTYSKENKVQKYKVTLILTADDYMGLIPHLGSVNPKIEKVVDKPEELDPSAMRGRGQVIRTKRKSKVIDTILDALQGGSAPAAELRAALAARGMSESSLSTGLSILQKSGQIQRDVDGSYFLTGREAA